jgi:hypothetical protein
MRACRIWTSQNNLVGISLANIRFVGATGRLFQSRPAPWASCVISKAAIPVPPMRKHRWRARCVSKGARRVRRRAPKTRGKLSGGRRMPTLRAL